MGGHASSGATVYACGWRSAAWSRDPTRSSSGRVVVGLRTPRASSRSARRRRSWAGWCWPTGWSASPTRRRPTAARSRGRRLGRRRRRAAAGSGPIAQVPTGVVVRADPAADRPREPVVVDDRLARVDLGPGDEVGQRRGPADPAGGPRGLDHPRQVVGMAQVGGVDARRVGGIGGPQPHRAARAWPEKPGDDPEDRAAGDGGVVEGAGDEQVQVRRVRRGRQSWTAW